MAESVASAPSPSQNLRIIGRSKSLLEYQSQASSNQNLGFCKDMLKKDLIQKLHESLCEKDRLTEQMSQALREKLESENTMIQLTHELGNLKVAYNELQVDRQQKYMNQ